LRCFALAGGSGAFQRIVPVPGTLLRNIYVSLFMIFESLKKHQKTFRLSPVIPFALLVPSASVLPEY
jgi:hypothetical protein